MMDDEHASQKRELFIGSELRPKVGDEARSEPGSVSSEATNKEIEAAALKALKEGGSATDSTPVQWEQWKDCRLQSHEDVHSTILEGEAVLLNLDNGMYYSLNRVGTVIWELCDGQRTFADILEKICDRFEVDRHQARRDLMTITSQLVEQKLLIKVGS